MKNRWLKQMFAFTITIGSLCTGFSHVSASSVSFDDINSYWAKKQIVNLANERVVSGIDEDTFAPNKPLTRAQFTVMLAKILKENLRTSGSAAEVGKYFSDVSFSAFYADELVRLRKANIIDDRGAFHGDRQITREEMAHYLVKGYTYLYAQDLSSFVTSHEIPFKDAQQIASRYMKDVMIADKINLIFGRSNGDFNPKSSLTRGEAASVMYRFGQIVPYKEKDKRSGQFADKYDAYYKNGQLYITFTYDINGAGFDGQILVITRSGTQLKINVEQIKLDNSSSGNVFKQMRTITVHEAGVSKVIVIMNGKQTASFNV
ncbi:S-layer homology domain-containing protein [Aneurinibacillus terranovensis]|uniref:S-layer homology domain-containing protein n=1 Tax=Aneurinibacillus terranovensis TaxID=278991 RepID=UPI0004031921|nr:S-layer homology domain-containing protein [Aneurinibacillus terranovensis]